MPTARLATVAATAALLFAACSSAAAKPSTSASTFTPPPSAPVAATTSAPTTAAPTTTVAPTTSTTLGAVHVGDGRSYTLTSTTYLGEAVKVELVRYLANAGTDTYNGQQIHAIQVRLTNVGTIEYKDSPDNGFTIYDTLGQSYASSLTVTPTPIGPPFAGGSVDLAVGDVALGVLTADAPATVTVAKIRFGLDSGFGQHGDWLVP